jgi:hypothetical protein
MALFAGASVRQSQRRNSEVAHFGLLFFPNSEGTLQSVQTLALGFHSLREGSQGGAGNYANHPYS